MLNLKRLVTRNPLSIIATLWPLALLAPLVPGLPSSTAQSSPWPQELVIALLLLATTAPLAWRLRRPGASAFTLRRVELFAILSLGLFFLWSAASIFWSASTFPAVHHTLLWGAYILFFLLLSRAARSPRLLRSSVRTLAFVVSVISVSSMIEFWGSSALLIRSSTGLSEPLAVALPFFAVLALRVRRGRAALLFGATAVLAWFAVLQSLERAPALGVCAALLVAAAASFLRRDWRPRSLKRAAALAALFAAATLLQTLPSPQTEGRPSFVIRMQTAPTEDDSSGVRLLSWAVGLEMWHENPLKGVGADNYETAYPEARARFAAAHPDSRLIGLYEQLLVKRAHNEYVQILSELGAVGFALFLAFGASLMLASWRALRRARSPLALGAVCGLVVFALSSGASSVSFRWMGSGLVFFFLAALVMRLSPAPPAAEAKAFKLAPAFARPALASALLFSLLIVAGRGVQATSAFVQSRAQSARNMASVQDLYEKSLALMPLDASTRFNYGLLLYMKRRPAEAVPHLSYAVGHGFNSSAIYAYLAGAQAGAGDLRGAEQTLAFAVRVYPRSVFLRVRHASSLAEAGRNDEAGEEYAAALSMDARAARGWRLLISFGRDAAKVAAFRDKSIAMPGELRPENCIFAVLDENERRQPVAVLEEGGTAVASKQ